MQHIWLTPASRVTLFVFNTPIYIRPGTVCTVSHCESASRGSLLFGFASPASCSSPGYSLNPTAVNSQPPESASGQPHLYTITRKQYTQRRNTTSACPAMVYTITPISLSRSASASTSGGKLLTTCTTGVVLQLGWHIKIYIYITTRRDS